MRASRTLVSLRTYGLAFAIALSPALMQGADSGCAANADTTLSSFEIEVLGQNHIAFDSDQRVYWVWLPSIADTAIVRAYSNDPAAEVTWVYQDAAEDVIEAGWFSSFIGGGEVTLDGMLVPGRSYLRVYVKHPGTAASKNYTAVLQVGCGDCDDQIACTQDACDPLLDACAHPLESGCSPSASAILASFELEVLGQQQIDFDSGEQDYWAWLPGIADTAIVRAIAVDAFAEMTFEYRNAVGDLLELRSFLRSGEITLDGLVPPEQSVLRVWVKDPDGALRIYTVDMYVGCVDCDDGNECTSDACDPTLEMCVHPPEPGGAACDAGGIPGICVDTTCAAFCSATNCDDGNACTADSCDSVLGVCEHTVLADGSACGPGICYAGACSCAQGCDDGNDCTNDACDVPADVCVHTPVADGLLCSGDLGICHAGNCACAQGCDDGSECTVDACNPAADLCEHTPLPDGTACPGAGSCEAGGCVGGTFACTEQGIIEAIAAGGGPHTFACGGPTSVVTTGTIVIDNGVILDGRGDLAVGLSPYDVFEVSAGVTAELHGLAIEPGMSGGCIPGCIGRGCCFSFPMNGIHNLGTLTLANSSVTDGASAVLNDAATLTVINTDMSGNHFGIQGSGNLAVIDSTVSGSLQVGIQTTGALTVANSAVSGSAAEGLHISGSETATVTDSTVSGSVGAGILFVGSGPLTVINSTVTDNNPALVNAGAVTLENSIVVGACYGALSSLGYNIESPGDTCGFDQGTDLINVPDVNLGPLQDNGGPTETHALLPGSVAIDWIPAAMCQASQDQRGVTRPQGTACDVGAFELEQ